MKKLATTFLTIALTITTFTSCSKDDETPITLPIDPLPSTITYAQTTVTGTQFAAVYNHQSIVFNN